MFQLGLEKLLASEELMGQLKGRKVAYVGHPASVTQKLEHGFDLLAGHAEIPLAAAFGPQHGILGEKQDNMIESESYIDPTYNIPVFSLYGDVRRPTAEMMDSFDVVLVDLQDVGCRIYTYLTTLIYLIEECNKADKEIWVLDRPNPAGRPVEGVYLDESQHSFVGAARAPIRHGLTLGELSVWYKESQGFTDLNLVVVKMEGYNPEESPGYGWPQGQLAWVNPSPNLSNFHSTRLFCGTVLFEGTKLSEGRGTTRALEQFGAPGMDGREIIKEMKQIEPKLFNGVLVRPCYFEPTFQKHAEKRCGGLAMHVDVDAVYRHDFFQPFRFCSLALKVIRNIYPDFELWQSPPYEYETEKMPVDMLSGSTELREWVDNESGTYQQWSERLLQDENDWIEQRQRFLLY